MTTYRIEEDCLGQIKVKADKYWKSQTQRSLENFKIGQELMPKSLIHSFAILKEACAKANLHFHKISEKQCEAIVKVCQNIEDGQYLDQFPLHVWQTGSGTQTNMNANEVISMLGNEYAKENILHPNDTVNVSQSSNDTFPAALHIMVAQKINEELLPQLDQMINQIKKLEEENEGIIKIGRTHLQDAVPITLGQEMSAYASGVNRGLRRIEHALINLHYINMGGTAIGTGLNAEPNYIPEVAKILSVLAEEDFHVAENLIDATNNTDGFADMSSALKNTALMLIKMANDFRLMASGPRCGLNELKLPARQPGSSIMPGKVNPVIAEVLNQTCYQIIGNDTAICLAVENGQFELNVMEPVIAFNIFNSLKYMTNAVNTFVDNLLIDLEANKEQCYTWLNHSVGTITALLPHIGYENASMIAKEAYQTNKPVREIILSKNLLTEEELDIILSPSEMTRPGIAGDKLLKENLQKRA